MYGQRCQDRDGVTKPVKKDETGTTAASSSKSSTAAPSAEESKELDEDKLNQQKLKDLRKIKPVKDQKKTKMSAKNMYHESFFFKILGLMDFYSSLACISPAALALVQQFANPHKLNILIQLLIAGHSRGKIIVLRIFQDLMKLDFPTEIFDRAVTISSKAAENGQGNTLEAELNELLKTESALDLSQVTFFKLIYAMILKC